MGQIILPASGPVYVDANALIYRVEQIEPYLSVAMPLWDALDRVAVVVHTAELSLLECLVKPLREGKDDIAALYRRVLLNTIGLECMPVTRSVLERAAGIRAAYGLKTPDAIHAATAMSSDCRLFVTNDAGFRRVPGLNVAVLGEIARV